MSTYADSGVDIEMGDKSSSIAYQAAKATFVSRKGMIGEPLVDDGGFAGLLDMGDFYLVQNDDGVGTKIEIAEKINKLETLGYDLLAMVLDDAVCLGAEPISVTNTLDVNKVDPGKVEALMEGLKKAAIKHKIAIPGGEIAELGTMVNGYLWNATCVGIVEKNKIIKGDKITKGDLLIALHSDGLRSNGFSLVRHILKNNFGENWYGEEFKPGLSWAEAVLTPSKIYSSAIMEMHGRYGQAGIVDLKGIAHITGGGIAGNLSRILKGKNIGAKIDKLPQAHEMVLRLMELGKVAKEEAYKTWNMGVGMILVVAESELNKISEICEKHQVRHSVIGEIVEQPGISMDFS